jgi:hypothetical protein
MSTPGCTLFVFSIFHFPFSIFIFYMFVFSISIFMFLFFAYCSWPCMSFRISLLVVASWIESVFGRLVDVRPRASPAPPKLPKKRKRRDHSFMTAMPQATVRQHCTTQTINKQKRTNTIQKTFSKRKGRAHYFE